jgi:hypothetical protein
VYFEFGDNAKIHQFEISWRNVRPSKLLQNFVTKEEIVRSIKERRTQLPLIDDIPLEGIKRVTITNAMPRYPRKSGDEPMDLIVPVLQLDAVMETIKTNRPVWFQTKLVKEF